MLEAGNPSLDEVIKNLKLNSDTRFVLFCLTCKMVLLEYPKNPAANSTTNRVMRSTAFDHEDAFVAQHDVLLLDVNKDVVLSPFVVTFKVN